MALNEQAYAQLICTLPRISLREKVDLLKFLQSFEFQQPEDSRSSITNCKISLLHTFLTCESTLDNTVIIHLLSSRFNVNLSESLSTPKLIVFHAIPRSDVSTHWDLSYSNKLCRIAQTLQVTKRNSVTYVYTGFGRAVVQWCDPFTDEVSIKYIDAEDGGYSILSCKALVNRYTSAKIAGYLK